MTRNKQGLQQMICDFEYSKYLPSILTIALLTFFLNLSAETIIPDRPGFAYSTAVIPVGTLQLETGYNYSKELAQHTHSFGEIWIRIPVSSAFEMDLGVNSWFSSKFGGARQSGYSGSSIGLKYNILSSDEPGLAALTTTINATMPNGSDSFRTAHLEPGIMFIADFATISSLTVSAFASYTRASSESDGYNSGGAGITLGGSLWDRMGYFVQYYASIVERNFGSDKHWLAGGFTYLLSEFYQVDLHAGAPVNGASPSYYLGCGFSTYFDL